MKINFPSCPLPQDATTWAYLRDSGGETQDLASQRAYVLAYCQHHHLRLVRIFEDGAISGGTVAGRDEFELMIEMARRAERPAVDGIIYWDTKRFARNQLDSQFYKSDLRRRGYRLISISDDIPDNEFSGVFEAFLEWKAEKDRADISKDTKRGLSFIVGMTDEAGQFLGLAPGRPPTCFIGTPHDTGLKRNNGKPRIVQRWTPDPVTWERGQKAWQMRAERASYDQIQAECKLFSAINVGSCYLGFFANEIYIGRFHYSGRIYEDFVPALTTVELFNRVQQMSYSRPRLGQKFPKEKIHPKTGRARRYLLSGLCECDFCGAAMHGSQNTRKDRENYWLFYICAAKQAQRASCAAKSISAQRLEAATIEVVMTRILTLDFVGKLVEHVNDILADTDQLKAILDDTQQKIKSLNRAISNLLDLAETHPSADVLNRIKEREFEREIKRAEANRLERQVKQRSFRVDERAVVSMLDEMKLTLSLSEAEISARRYILGQVVDKIKVGHDLARLYYKFPLNLLYWDYYMPSTEIVSIPILYTF